MKKLLMSITILFVATFSFAQGHTYVHGYTRSNGTYVQPHYRTSPNNTRNDNWSTIGNVNPYTGVEGTKPMDSYYSSYRSSYTSPVTYELDLPSISRYSNYTYQSNSRITSNSRSYTSPSYSANEIINGNSSIYTSAIKTINSNYWPY